LEKDKQDNIVSENFTGSNIRKTIFPTIATFAILGVLFNFYMIWSTNSFGRIFYSANLCSLADKSRHMASQRMGFYGPACYTKSAGEQKKQAICENLLPIVAEKRIDIEQYTDCLDRSGDVSKDISFCNKFENPADAKRCVGASLHTYGVKTEICEKLTLSSAKDYCKYLLEDENNDPLYCRNIQDKDIRDRCYFSIVVRQYTNDDMDTCNQIQDGRKRDECKLGVITHGYGGKELCSTIENDEIRQDCLTYGDPSLIVAINNVEECAAVSSDEEQIKCMNNFAVNQKEKSITSHDCVIFPKFSEAADYCEHLVDAKQKIVSFCSNFLSDRFKKECKAGQLNW